MTSFFCINARRPLLAKCREHAAMMAAESRWMNTADYWYNVL